MENSLEGMCEIFLFLVGSCFLRPLGGMLILLSGYWKKMDFTPHSYELNISKFNQKKVLIYSCFQFLLMKCTAISILICPRSCKRSKTLFQISLLLFSTWRSTSIASQVTSPASQKSKDLNKVLLLLQYLA